MTARTKTEDSSTAGAGFSPNIQATAPATAPYRVEKHPGKVRHCWNCGADMGFIENRHYDRMDACGSFECQRAERDAYAQERAEAHDRLDRDNGWDRW